MTDRRVIIQTDNITRTYVMGETTIHALQGVSITIYEGEMVAIVGQSGSGKSTLMAILGALDRPTSGIYKLDGYETSRIHADDLAVIRNWRIGFVFQKFYLMPRSTALENVAMPLIYAGVGLRERTEKAKHALQLVDLADRMYHKPPELSGGQQQRVAIARALVNNPALILADEPTGNLDSRTGEEIMRLFHRLHQEEGITLIIVTHDSSIANQAQHIITLRDGCIISEVNHVTHP